MVKGPCKDCERRHLGCHGKCDDYAEYKNALAADKDERFRANVIDNLNFNAHGKVNLRAKQNGRSR